MSIYIVLNTGDFIIFFDTDLKMLLYLILQRKRFDTISMEFLLATITLQVVTTISLLNCFNEESKQTGLQI